MGQMALQLHGVQGLVEQTVGLLGVVVEEGLR